MQTILLLHGALGSRKDLENLERAIKQVHTNVHSFTFSGHGGTAFDVHFGINQFASELHKYITLNQLKKPIVFGYSMGGYVALTLALKEPELLGKVICLGTKFEWNKTFVNKETTMLDADYITEKNPSFAKSLQDTHGFQWKELLIKTADMMRDLAVSPTLNTNNLAAIKVPALIGLADNDKMVSLAETTDVFKTIPGAAMFMLPKSKHQMATVNTAILSKIIDEFIDKTAEF